MLNQIKILLPPEYLKSNFFSYFYCLTQSENIPKINSQFKTQKIIICRCCKLAPNVDLAVFLCSLYIYFIVFCVRIKHEVMKKPKCL